MIKILGFLTLPFLSALIFCLNAFLPGRWVTGYINKKDSNEKEKYHLNGILVFFVIVLAWLAIGYFGVLPFDWLYRIRWYSLAGAFISGLIFSLAVVLPFSPVRNSFIKDLFFGRIENLQFLNKKVDVKMWLYLSGAIMLELNALSFTAHHVIIYGAQASAGILLSTALMTFFIIDYMIFEEIHLYTYDLFAERVGFKLGWGCLVFYPYFYCVFLWFAADLPDPHTSAGLLTVFMIIFFSGWVLSRGANLQKYFFKRNPERKFLWIKPQTISGGNRTLLVNGFWGLSRHINYLGEILMASGIVLCTGYPASIWIWLYPVYYVLLLFPRERDDNRRCRQKYGDLWQTYEKMVRWRIIPFVY